MENCSKLLEASLKRAQKNLGHSFIHNEEIAARVAAVVNCPSNRAGVRLLMACMLAKAHRPEIDPRKPYTKIGSKDCFSGRSYDEQFIGDFITRTEKERTTYSWHVLGGISVSLPVLPLSIFAEGRFEDVGGTFSPKVGSVYGGLNVEFP